MSEFTNASTTIPCERCGAEVGQRCRSPKGRITYTHAVRDRIIRGAFFWGYEAGLRDAINNPTSAGAQLRFFARRHEDDD